MWLDGSGNIRFVDNQLVRALTIAEPGHPLALRTIGPVGEVAIPPPFDGVAQTDGNVLRVVGCAVMLRAAYGPELRVANGFCNPALNIVGGHGRRLLLVPTHASAISYPGLRMADVDIPDSGFSPLSYRYIDTRSSAVPRVAGQPLRVEVSRSAAIALNLTAIDARSKGYLVAYPCNDPIPATSNLNVAVGETRANVVVIPLTRDDVPCVVSTVAIHLDIVDVVGGFQYGSTFVPTEIRRRADTRQGGARPGRDAPLRVPLPDAPSDTVAVVVNLTAALAKAPGWVTVFDCAAGRPATSNLNFTPGATVAAAAIVPISAGGSLCVEPTSLINRTRRHPHSTLGVAIRLPT